MKLAPGGVPKVSTVKYTQFGRMQDNSWRSYHSVWRFYEIVLGYGTTLRQGSAVCTIYCRNGVASEASSLGVAMSPTSTTITTKSIISEAGTFSWPGGVVEKVQASFEEYWDLPWWCPSSLWRVRPCPDEWRRPGRACIDTPSLMTSTDLRP